MVKEEEKKSKGLSGGAIAGIVIGSIVLLVIIGLFLYRSSNLSNNVELKKYNNFQHTQLQNQWADMKAKMFKK